MPLEAEYVKEILDILKSANVEAYESGEFKVRFRPPAPILPEREPEEDDDELYGASNVRPAKLGTLTLQPLSREEIRNG